MKKRQDWIIIERLGDIILNNVEGHLFEIGIGFSTPIFYKLATDFDRDLYCFDRKESRCNWAKLFGCTVFQGKSLDNIEKLSDIPLAMGLIDGQHKARTVRSEVLFLLERLSVGGVIFLHDTYRITSPLLKPERKNLHDKKMIGDVYKVRQELETLDNVQTFTWPYTAIDSGLTMIMKMDPDRPFFET